MKVANEMSPVTQCSATSCSYNLNQKCHAKAVTIGDTQTPHCDTFVDGATRSKEAKRTAGVGACKVASCRFNDDLECAADSIVVKHDGSQVKCETYSPRP